jgi:hypothetical protein
VNKVTGDIKAMILGALSDAGGRAYLAKQAQQNPTAFMALLGKVLPLQVSNPDGGPVFVITGVLRETEDTTPPAPELTYDGETYDFQTH